jgi:L-threonylcarbamoyladenylate synthase
MLLRIRPGTSLDNRINKTVIKLAAQSLAGGDVALLPTSTIFGLSCVYNNKPALKRIYEIKKRPLSAPFIVIISSIDCLEMLIAEETEAAKILIEHYWLSDNPQPLTMLFKKNRQIYSYVTGKNPNIAIRLDPLPALQKIVSICGPVVSTSASISGTGISPLNITEIPEEIKKHADIIVDPGFNLSGTASTVIDVTSEDPVLIREGKVTHSEILKILSLKSKKQN